MKLRYLSISSIIACLAGLMVLLVVAYAMVGDIRHQQSQIRALLTLDQRASALAVAGNHLLLYHPDEDLRQAFILEAQAVKDEFRRLEGEYPGAGKVARHIDLMLDMLDAEHAIAPNALAGVDGVGPLDVSRRSRILMGQMASHGTALEATVISLLHEREADIARQTNRAVAAFAFATFLFGSLCVLAFVLIHRRVTGPVQRMAGVIQQLASGEAGARVTVRGRDELTELGTGFNRLLDQQQAAEAELRNYEQALEARARALAESQRIARVGSLRFHVASGRLEWSQETCRIFGIAPDAFTGTLEEFLSRIHPDDVDAFSAQRERTLADGKPLDAEYRIIRPDGETRFLHHRSEREVDDEGNALFLVGTIQDVTEQRAASERIRHQQKMLDMAGRVARVGGWFVDPVSEVVHMSDVVCDIHGIPRGTVLPIDEAIAFYSSESHDQIRHLYQRCIDEGKAFDAELEIVSANGQHVWVRSTGEAVHDRCGELLRVQGAFQDITAHKQSEEMAQKMARQLYTTLGNLGEAFFTLDREWRFTYLNTKAEALMKVTPDVLIGETVWDKYPELEGGPVGDAYHRAMNEGKSSVVTEYYHPPLKTWFDIRVYPSETGLAVFFMDVSERHRMIQQLRDQESDIRLSRDQLSSVLRTRQILINSLPAHIALLAPDGEILDVNEHWRQFARENDMPEDALGVGVNYLAVCRNASGPDGEEAIPFAVGLEQVLNGERSSFSLEYPCHAPHEERWFRVSVNQLSQIGGSDTEPGAVVMHVDITERKRAENDLNRLAFEDPLTHVLSRNGFTRELGGRMGRKGWRSDAMVVMLDLINLRHVNDAHGYTIGDRLLEQVGQRLSDYAGEEGLVGRAGGDEFMVYMAPSSGQSGPNKREELAAVFEQPFQVEGFPIEIVGRFGYTRLGKRRRPIEQLLREAELALFHRAGSKDGIHWSAYTSQLDKDTRERIELTHELRRALDRDEFELYFQPKVDMNSGRIVAAEALIRWHHPERGMVSPALFIPVAEQSQLIGPIGEWVLNAACQTLAEWQNAGLDIVRIAVNVSLDQFSFGDFTKTVTNVLQGSGVAPDGLSLEITESVFEREADGLMAQLTELHKSGIRLSLDDFGTGYSSLLYLQKYPFDEIKIDQGFVSGMLNDHYSREIVKTVIGMADVIGAEAVAEGVETVAERDALLGMGCHIAQGYYFSRPLPKDAFRSLLESNEALPVKSA